MSSSASDHTRAAEPGLPEANREALQDLTSRVESAEGWLNEDVLGRVICAAIGKPFDSAVLSCGDDGSDELSVYAEGEEWHVWSGYRHLAPDASCDAALALVEQALPDWCSQVTNYAGLGAVATLWPNTERYYTADLPSAPRAVLAALLKAVSATGLAAGNQTPPDGDGSPEATSIPPTKQIDGEG